MKVFQRVVLVAGFVTLGVLFWKMDAGAVLTLVLQVGCGFILILSQEIVAHLFNALGWRYALRPQHVASFPFLKLLKFRIVGDAVNYLTPSASTAGEVARASLMGDSESFDDRLAGVVVAKCTQGLAQILFVLFGIAWLVGGMIPAIAPFQGLLRVLATISALALAGLIVWEKRRKEPAALRSSNGSPGGPKPASNGGAAPSGSFMASLRGVPKQLRLYLQDHPGRNALSVVFFVLGYAWNAFEVYWICRFLDVPVSWGTALAIEVLSNIVDGVLFMVPAKVGTQEAGKTAIFVLLGLPARAGFAFGVVRHIRELSWGAFGLLLYSAHLKGRRRTVPAETPVAGAPGAAVCGSPALAETAALGGDVKRAPAA
ncbi:MAG: lysylphosphatidylglycerol synthase transmembrane domain-containing protein [Elusimicrobiota bacterium]